jgi:DNA-binding PadR family transcriptional regulator
MPDELPDLDGQLKGTLDRIDSLLSHRVRLGICVLLSRHTALSFSRLKQLLEETDGSLGAQLRRLEEEGFLMVSKEFLGRRPVTWYSLTPRGRQRLGEHLDSLARLIDK